MPSTIGKVLRQHRTTQGLSMRKAAALADLDQAVLSRIENGHRLPTDAQLAALAPVYGQDLDRLHALTAYSEFKEKHGSAPYYAECVNLLHEDAAAYHASPRRPTGGRAARSPFPCE